MGKLNIGLMVTVLAVLAVLTLLFVAAYLFAPDAARVKDALWVMQVVVTTLAIVLGGAFAAYKWQVFRESEPHLTITNRVSRRFVGDSYVHIAVTAELRNGSRVQVELLKGIFSLQLLSPTTDELVESLYGQVFEKGTHTTLLWPIIDEAERDWDRGELIVEPGESHSETFEFIALNDVEAVMIYTYFYNSRYSKGIRAVEGWGASTVHDMIKGRDRVHTQGGCSGSQRQEHQDGGRDKGNRPQAEAGES